MRFGAAFEALQDGARGIRSARWPENLTLVLDGLTLAWCVQHNDGYRAIEPVTVLLARELTLSDWVVDQPPNHGGA